MHDSVLAFIGRLKNDHAELFSRKRILEVGSLIINGSPRKFFTECEYLGLDWRKGTGVDLVSIAHEYIPRLKYDVVISTSMLEHDPYFYRSIRSMVDCVCVGGSLIITCAGVGFDPHEIDTSPEKGWYRNLRTSNVLNIITYCARFEKIVCEDDEINHDLRIFCYKKIGPIEAKKEVQS